MDGISLNIIGGTALTTLGGIAGAWIKAKFAKNPQPFETHRVNDCITVQECNRKMAAIDGRVTRLERKVDNGFEKIIDKLSALDNRSEDRANALYRRLDAVIDNRAK